MKETNKGLLSRNTLVDEKYRVLLFVKKGNESESYRVKGPDGKLYLLKLFDLAAMPPHALDDQRVPREIALVQTLEHPNLLAYADDGKLTLDGKEYAYMMTEFIAGETLAERVARDPFTALYDVRRIATDILQGLAYLHALPTPVMHNEISPWNVMIDLSGTPPRARIIDFGHACFAGQPGSHDGTGGDRHHQAPEVIHEKKFSPRSDLFSVGAVIYRMIFGISPWEQPVSRYVAERASKEEILAAAREKGLAFPELVHKMVDFDDAILRVIETALQVEADRRYPSATDFMQALQQQEVVQEGQRESPVERSNKKRGFAAIAGMQQLKEEMMNDVINVLRNPREYKRHNLGLPNGMLLYGPPGCGKTFFAKRFAEEAGYNFIEVIASDLASIFIHGTQEKIGKLFKEAREKAPTILYFDELDAMVPSRETLQNQGQSGEINEFLSQLDNIGDSGVFVIGSTNKPELIDKAILRAGRLEKWFWIPPPDFEARKAMFELYLKDRPLEPGIDYDLLAELTGNYVSGDIKFLVDEASRRTIREQLERVSMETLVLVINRQKPTIPLSELKKYETIRSKMLGEDDESKKPPRRPPIGFKQKPT